MTLTWTQNGLTVICWKDNFRVWTILAGDPGKSYDFLFLCIFRRFFLIYRIWSYDNYVCDEFIATFSFHSRCFAWNFKAFSGFPLLSVMEQTQRARAAYAYKDKSVVDFSRAHRRSLLFSNSTRNPKVMSLCSDMIHVFLVNTHIDWFYFLFEAVTWGCVAMHSW